MPYTTHAMYISFNGGQDLVDTTQLRPVPVYTPGPYNTPISTSPAMWGGYLAAGDYQYENAGAGGNFVMWQTLSGAYSRMWPMDDADAVRLLLFTTIPTALAADEAYIAVLPDGEIGAS